MHQVPLLRRAAAEGLGTFALVVVGCGAIVVDAGTGSIGHAGIAAAFGLVVLVVIASTGHISGAHINPVVTIAFALTRHFPRRDVPAYVSSQLVGACVGAVVLQAIFGDIANLGATVPQSRAVQSVAVEMLLTAILMFIIMAVATDTRAAGEFAALSIGATVGLSALWAGPVSGASMNPARSLGPAIVSGAWTDQWVYLVGPLAGAVIGALAYQKVRGRS